MTPWTVERRPTNRAMQTALWTWLFACGLTGAVIASIVADRARVAIQRIRLEGSKP